MGSRAYGRVARILSHQCMQSPLESQMCLLVECLCVSDGVLVACLSSSQVPGTRAQDCSKS